MTHLTQFKSGRIVAVSISLRKNTKKTNIREGRLIEGIGLENDAHAGYWHRQVSLLAIESIDKILDNGLDVKPGDFAENITTEGIRLWELPVGTLMRLGNEALVKVTQIGKECHDRCAIFRQVGDCVMPREGIFARVIKKGAIKPGDPIHVLSKVETPSKATRRLGTNKSIKHAATS